MKATTVLILLSMTTTVWGGVVEYDFFQDPKVYGQDTFQIGVDTLLVDFDRHSDGTPIASGTIVDTLFLDIGVSTSAIITGGAHIGEVTTTQAINYLVAPNGGWQPAVSSPNILSGVSPDYGPGWGVDPSCPSDIIISFVTQDGSPGVVSAAGAFNDYGAIADSLLVYSGPNGTGDLLGTVPCEAQGDFMGWYSERGIGSIRFSGESTEIDNLVFTTVVPEPATLSLLALGGIVLLRRK